MLEIVHLGPKEKPPAGEKFFLIECNPRRRKVVIIQDQKGSTHRIHTRDYAAEIADIRQKAEGPVTTKVYVRGAPDAPKP